MNASRRARQKLNRLKAGRHTHDDHAALHARGEIRCTVCRPLPTGKQAAPQRAQRGYAVTSGLFEALMKVHSRAARSESIAAFYRSRRRR